MTLITASGRRRRPMMLSPLNVVVDGNSIWDNYYTSFGKFDQHMLQFEPLKSSGATTYCSALSGAKWADLITRAPAQVDARWADGMENVLVVNETVNSLRSGGLSAEQVKAQIATYLSGRLALHQWRVIFCKCPPWGGGATYTAQLDARLEVNGWVEANASALGIERVVGLSSIPQFNHDGKQPGPFQQYAADWQESSNWLHPKDAPKLLWAKAIVNVMAEM